MNIKVNGIQIKLIPAQQAIIDKHKKKMRAASNNFAATLRRFGFKQIPDQPDSFQHIYYNWYAEILDRGNWKDVWLAGEGLKEAPGFPGGYIYDTTEQIANELNRALSNIKL